MISWFKLDHNIINDLRLRRFSSEEKWVWLTLLCLASQSDDRGTITADSEDIADLCDYEQQDLKYLLDKFRVKGLIDYSPEGIKITDWDKKQRCKPSDTPEATRERKRKQRARSRDLPPDSHTPVTPLSRDCSATDKIRSEEKRVDTEEIRERVDPETRAKIFENFDFVEIATEPGKVDRPVEVLNDRISLVPSKTTNVPPAPPRTSCERQNHALSCGAKSDPDYVRFRTFYERLCNVTNGNAGNRTDSEWAWDHIQQDGPIVNDEFWQGLEAYGQQKIAQFRSEGRAIGVKGCKNFLLDREWITALEKQRVQQQALNHGVDLTSPQSVKAAAVSAQTDVAFEGMKKLREERRNAVR